MASKRRARRTKWSLGRIINELRQLHREGIQLTEPALRAAGRGGLVQAARKLAGSLPGARKLAGVPGPRRWSKARVIAAIRARGSQATRALPKSLASTGIKYFGSIRAARTAAGVPSRMTEWSHDAIIKALRQRAARGEILDKKLHKACQRYFGSTAAAQRAAGLPAQPRWSRARVLEELRRTSRGLPHTLAYGCRRYFGSVAAARAAAGLAPAPRTERWSKQSVIAEIRKQVARGEPFTPRLASACIAYFGSLNDAREAAGVQTVKKRWSRDSVIAELRRRRGIADARLRRAALNQFGSIQVAYAMAGLAPRRVRWTRQLVLAELRAGRSSQRLLRAAEYHFGSLSKARRTARRRAD